MTSLLDDVTSGLDDVISGHDIITHDFLGAHA